MNKEVKETIKILQNNSLVKSGSYEFIGDSDITYAEIYILLKFIEDLQQEKEKLHHYKTLYQSLKGQKEELRSWLVEQEKKSWDEVSSTFGYVLDKLEELEGVSNE